MIGRLVLIGLVAAVLLGSDLAVVALVVAALWALTGGRSSRA